MGMEFSEAMVSEIVRKVLGQATPGFEKVRDGSGVMAIRAAQVKPEPFDTGHPGDSVFLQDIVSLAESPRMGCGIMELRQGGFNWTLTYDEFDYIIQGTLEIFIGGSVIRGEAGDVLFIPKGSAIRFSTPEFTRFLYVTDPADWANQK